jgi:hypothetical protein
LARKCGKHTSSEQLEALPWQFRAQAWQSRLQRIRFNNTPGHLFMLESTAELLFRPFTLYSTCASE